LIGAEVDNVECAKELARQKKGVALMFLPNIKEEVAFRKLKIIPVKDGEIRLGIDIARNQEMVLSPLSNAFIGVIEKHFGYLLSHENSQRSVN
jgi:DNA-binding transcriptional LysR family regulator